MFGISEFEILSFIRQAGLALSGASCLWGMYFFIKGNRSNGEKARVLHETSEKMLGPLSLGVILTIISWVWYEILYPTVVLAHEGISLLPDMEQVGVAFKHMTPFFLAFIAIYALGLICRHANKEKFYKRIHLFYAVEFVLAFIIISTPAWAGQLDATQLFYAGHGFHSIFTLGTVLVLDFVFILTKYSDLFEKHLYPTLPIISKVIWVGLAIDFASVGLVFDQAIAHTPKFMFMQTVIAIIIINGAFLSGPIARKLMEVTEKESVDSPTPFWDRAMTISGSVSAASWLTVTFTDLIHDVSVGYPTLMGIYMAFIASVYIAYEILEHYKIGSRW